jgi:hypothetical protein
MGGSLDYDPNSSVLAHVSQDSAQALKLGRRAVQGLLGDRSVTRQGKALADLPYNNDLRDGPDLGGTARGGIYLSAVQRYRGRFFERLGSEGKRRLLDGPHYVLILSGLYGLLSPTEPIQAR